MNIDETLKEYGLTPERYEELLKDCSDKVNKVSDIDWGEINSKYSLDFNPDTIRKSCQPPITGSVFVSEYYKEKYAKDNSYNENDYMNELQVMKREIQKEKVKLQSEKLEYNKWLREEARDELITEKICDAIAALPPLEIPKRIECKELNKSGLLVFTDPHYGIEFNLKDLFGNTINEYSPEIFEKRMWELLDKTIDIVKKENFTELSIWCLGDEVQGIIRLNSQLMQLRYGIIDSAIMYGNFMIKWINELSKYVRIKFQMVKDSNHNQLRICGAPKNSFTEENVSKIILTMLKEALKDNLNVEIYENPTGMNFSLMSTYGVLGIHGELKGTFEGSINSMSRAYNCAIDYLIMGHGHHAKFEETGINSEVYMVRSIIGVDPYGLSLNKVSNAGASLFIFNQLDGLNCEYKIKLN